MTLLFQVTTEILIIFVPFIELYQLQALGALELIGFESSPGEDPAIAELRSLLYLIYYFLLVLKGTINLHRAYVRFKLLPLTL